MISNIDSVSDLCWWHEPWWNDPESVYPYAPADVERSVSVLKEFLSDKWLLDALTKCPQHYFASRILGVKGTSVARFIVGLAQLMGNLQGAQGFSRKLEDLKSIRHMSVYFEMETASAFASQGARIEFPKEGKEKTPDILVMGGFGRFAVECKRLEEERWEGWESDFLRRLAMSQLQTAEDGGCVVQVELNPRFSELRLEDQFNDINEQLLIEFERAIGSAVAKLSDISVAEWIEVGGLGRVRRVLKGEAVYGQISGVPVSRVAKLRRILRKGFLEAIEQLPRSMPGVVSVFSFHQVEPKLAKIALQAICEARPQDTEHVVALLICPGGTIFKHDPPLLLINEKSKFKAGDCESIEMLERAYGIKAI